MKADGLTAVQMLTITRELRQFEAVFLERTAHDMAVRARVFDLNEELPFAGHPLLGAAAALHHQDGAAGCCDCTLLLGSRSVRIRTTATDRGFAAIMDQGRPSFGQVIEDRECVAAAFSLSPADITPGLPVEVVSTGLAYMIVPVSADALTQAHIRSDLTPLLARFRAQFAVLLDESAVEIRHWNNDGVLEDVATGSAAGTIGAYRLKHGLAKDAQEFLIRQGRFAGRPSEIRVAAYGTTESVDAVSVGGPVVVVGRGELERLP